MSPIALVGGNEFRENCIEMDTALLAGLDSRAPRVLIIPTAAAKQGPQAAAQSGVRYFEQLGASALSAQILNREDADDLTKIANFDSVNMIYLTGGDPGYLRDTLIGTETLYALRRFVESGGLLVGSSAGAMAMAEQMRRGRSGEWSTGFEFAPGIAVLPHHEDTRDKPTAPSKAITIIGIDSATACYSADCKEWEVVGGGHVTIYAGEKRIECASGSRFNLSG